MLLNMQITITSVRIHHNERHGKQDKMMMVILIIIRTKYFFKLEKVRFKATSLIGSHQPIRWEIGWKGVALRVLYFTEEGGTSCFIFYGRGWHFVFYILRKGVALRVLYFTEPGGTSCEKLGGRGWHFVFYIFLDKKIPEAKTKQKLHSLIEMINGSRNVMNEKRKNYQLFFSYKPVKKSRKWLTYVTSDERHDCGAHNKKSQLGIELYAEDSGENYSRLKILAYVCEAIWNLYILCIRYRNILGDITRTQHWWERINHF